MTALQVFTGGGDMVAQLEDALERVKAGEIQGLVIVGITEEGHGWTGSIVHDLPYRRARMIAALTETNSEALERPLENWP